MNFLNLNYFITVAEEKSFTGAAKKLYISQQSLSRHIAKLEDEFGVILLNRTQPLSLTEAGEALYRSARAILDQKTQAEKSLQDFRDFRHGSLTIGIPLTRGTVILPEILPAFHKAFPQIRLNLKEGTTREINAALYAGETDLNIGFSLGDPEHVTEEHLYTERLMAAFPRSLLPLLPASRREALTPGSLQSFEVFEGCPFLRMPQGYWLRTLFDNCCEAHGIYPEIVLETASMASLVALCRAGLGVILLPATFVEHGTLFGGRTAVRDEVIIVKLDYPAGSRDVTINYLKDRYLSRAARELIRIAREKLVR